MRYLGVPGLSLQEEKKRNLMTVEYGPSLLGRLRDWFASNRAKVVCTLQL